MISFLFAVIMKNHGSFEIIFSLEEQDEELVKKSEYSHVFGNPRFSDVMEGATFDYFGPYCRGSPIPKDRKEGPPS